MALGQRLVRVLAGARDDETCACVLESRLDGSAGTAASQHEGGLAGEQRLVRLSQPALAETLSSMSEKPSTSVFSA
jgi:hypothetical protein